MAIENENFTPGDFKIQDTMEFAGSTELLNKLYEPETVSANPEEITSLKEEVVVPPEEPFVTPESAEENPEEKPDSKKNIISNFLEAEDDDATPPASTEEKPAEAPEEPQPAVTQFSALATDLFNLGVFTKEEGEEEVEINSPEEFLERFNAEKKKGAIETIDNFLEQFGEDYKAAFDAIYVKGVNPKEYFSVYNNLVDFAELDITVEDNQVKVMKQALLDQGYEPEDIETEIERLKNYGDLEAVAARNHKVLVKKDAQKLETITKKAQVELQQKAAVRSQYVQNVQTVLTEKLKNKEFDGLPLNPKLATELQDFLLVDKWKTATGETLTDFDRTILDLKKPENHAMKVKIALLMKILEKDPTLSTIQKTGVTKQSNKLFNEVAKQVTKAPAGAAQKTSSESWWDTKK